MCVSSLQYDIGQAYNIDHDLHFNPCHDVLMNYLIWVCEQACSKFIMHIYMHDFHLISLWRNTSSGVTQTLVTNGEIK